MGPFLTYSGQTTCPNVPLSVNCSPSTSRALNGALSDGNTLVIPFDASDTYRALSMPDFSLHLTNSRAAACSESGNALPTIGARETVLTREKLVVAPAVHGGVGEAEKGYMPYLIESKSAEMEAKTGVMD